VLTIAGSDSGGGAGIQADIKAISATGCYACSVITAITAQNTLGVSAIFPIPLEYVEKQLDAVFTDLNVVAVKVGMLADADTIHNKKYSIKPKY
jgi:hydroxymethylpyrimidine/phosphomethylpyrimidine kinase